MEVAVIYASSEGQTAKIAGVIATELENAGITSRLFDGRDSLRHISLSRFDGVIIGASVHAGRHQRYMETLVREHLLDLRQRPNGFFSVSLTAKQASQDPRMDDEVEGYVQVFQSATGWQPDISVAFAGALKYTEYNLFKRTLMQQVSKSRQAETDTTRDHEYTDWEAVRQFCVAFLDLMKVSK